MSEQEQRQTAPRLEVVADSMKRDWDDRARGDAKWFINTLRLQQSEEEFDQSGRVEVERLVLAELPLLTWGRAPQSLRVLEIGCGAGRMTKHLAQVFGDITGVDVSGEMIRQAQNRLAGQANVHLYETNGVDFRALPDASFDLILSAFVFQHVPSAEVIASNLREAWRVLAPGGVCKFQTSSIVTSDFDQLAKDTWSGASFPESALREFARSVGAQLISIFGAGTQYCWTTMRKPVTPVLANARVAPVIEYFGCTFDAQDKQIPVAGSRASLTVIVSGLGRELADCNSLRLLLGTEPVAPRYVGPIGNNFAPALQAELAVPLDGLTQVEIGVPNGFLPGIKPVFVQLGAAVSSPVEVAFVALPPPPPKIGTIMNAHDKGTDIFAQGPKSRLLILVEDVAESAATDNVRLQIGNAEITPLSVVYLAGNALHQVEAQLPDGIVAGETALRLYFGDLPVATATLDIKP